MEALAAETSQCYHASHINCTAHAKQNLKIVGDVFLTIFSWSSFPSMEFKPLFSTALDAIEKLPYFFVLL